MGYGRRQNTRDGVRSTGKYGFRNTTLAKTAAAATFRSSNARAHSIRYCIIYILSHDASVTTRARYYKERRANFAETGRMFRK